MITERRKFCLKTLEKEDIDAEVNFSTDKKVVNGQVIRFTFGDKQFSMKRDELTSLLLMIGDEKTQKSLLPVKTTSVKKLERILYFEFPAGRDYKKGEKIAVKAPWIDVIPTEDEIFAGSMKKRQPKFFGK